MFPAALSIRHHPFAWGSQTYIMGIINATPDSFSGDGLADGGDGAWIDAAVAQGRRFVAEGAHILDVGGESTRPGSQPVDADEELRRVLPVIRGLVDAVDVPISVDTSKAVVAEAALAAGASIVNDVWGFRLEPRIAEVTARAGALAVLMHNRSKREHVSIDPALGGRYVGTDYDDLIADIAAELQVSIDGVPASRPNASSSILASASARPWRRTWSCSTGWASCAAWASRSWPDPAASHSSATLWICRPTSASKAPRPPSPSPSPAAQTSCACMMC